MRVFKLGIDLYDESAHPTEGTLKQIELWCGNDFVGLMYFIEKSWMKPGLLAQAGTSLTFATGLILENERIIGALKRNKDFWRSCWESSHKGGRYVFDLSGPISRRVKLEKRNDSMSRTVK